MITENDKKELFDYIDSQKDSIINTLSELISYPSYRQEQSQGAPFGKPAAECLKHALDIMNSFGFITRNFDGYIGTAAFTDQQPLLGILAHLDVVPDGTGWTKHPFEASISDGKLFGRGAIDDKGPAVAVMYAMKAIKDMGIPLKSGVRLILGTDEECGSSDLEYYFKKEAPPKYTFTPDGNYPVINIEKGRVMCRFGATTSGSMSNRILLELSGGTVANAVPESAYAIVSGVDEEEIMNAVKSVVADVTFSLKDFGGCIRIDAHGISAHASTPEIGRNAITALLELISYLGLQDEASEKLIGISKLFPYGDTDGEGLGIKCSDEVSGTLTCVLSLISYDAGKLEASIDIRLPASFDYKDVSYKLEASLKASKLDIIDIHGAQAHVVSADSPFVKALLEVYEEVTGERGECIAIGGGTYVHEIEGGVAFGAEFLGDDNHMHSADEFICIDQLMLNVKMFALAILKICG